MLGLLRMGPPYSLGSLSLHTLSYSACLGCGRALQWLTVKWTVVTYLKLCGSQRTERHLSGD